MPDVAEPKRSPWRWWGRTLAIGLPSSFFLLFGIEGLIGSYRLQNALEFIMYFFSASLMILISLTGLIYVFFRIVALIKGLRGEKHEQA